MTESPRTVGDLQAAPYNPRTITEWELGALALSQDTFGDLGLIVENRRSGNLVGGHQRTKNLPADAPIIITESFDPPTRQGTVAIGYIEVAGERWGYRQVDWDEATELAANIAANKHGGTWDYAKLTPMLSELDANSFDMTLTGFDVNELTSLLGSPPSERSTSSQLGDVQYQVVITCADEHEQAHLCNEMEARGLQCRLLTL